MARIQIFMYSIFLSLLITSAQNNTHSESLRRQASVLIAVKQSFESSDRALSSWNESSFMQLCKWRGVGCDENGSVVSLDISNSNLSGSLSPAISELQNLVNLSVAGNSLSGNLPRGFYKIPRLRFLNLSNNIFSGCLGSELYALGELEVLDCYNNNFTCRLPEAVSRLDKLRHLDLGGNYFSGEIPKSYGGLIQLRFLSLAGNDLRGSIPGELGNLTQLQWLRLGYYNSFQGSIPSEFGRLSNLIHLDISSCDLQGEIPGELGNLQNLEILFLQTNRLNGSIPPELGNLSRLTLLDLSNNALTGEIPVQFSALRELTALNLFINNLHGEIPESISSLPKLEALNLWRNNFTGFIPPKLGENGRLVELDLSTNKLTGEIPKSLCFGRKLEILILLDNFLLGPLPDDLGWCTTLSRVRIGQNYLTGPIPAQFLYLPELRLVELQDNHLTGKIALEKNTASLKLEGLNLANSHLSGDLPASIGNFSGLKNLILSGNRFSGEIPPEIGRLRGVIKLDMSRNNFSWKIPPEISDCSSLTFLDLSQNQLSGPIPVEISRIRTLNYLNVSWNHLSHSLPEEIGSLKSLTSADFSHNNFSGPVPETGQYSFFNSTSFSGNPYLCDSSNSTPCNSSSSTQVKTRTDKFNIPSKYKLIFAMGLLLCSLIFVTFAVIKTRGGIRKNSRPRPWKLTACQKLEFGTEDVLSCLKDSNIIGRGGAGVVYKAIMPNGDIVAVKNLGISKGSHDNGLSAEVQTLGKIRHRYIVRLLAFCSNKETNLLVYEYMSNGSLGEVLHGENGGCLSWETRLKIAVEAAKGLAYLHHDCDPLIVHRDVKSNNILLDSDFEAHVADFGLAKFLQGNGASECMSAIAGSYGYIAPEYAYTLKVDEKSDVYSFGIVLLELITGRRPVGNFGEEGMDIVQWVKVETNWNKEGVVNIIDKRLKNNNVPIEEAKQVLFVAMLCVEEHSVERPTMREVVQMLAQSKQPNTFDIQ